MRSPLLTAALISLVLTILPAGAQAHAGEGGPLGVEDSFVLTAQGTVSDSFHTFLADMGIPGHEGETLRYFWSVNGGSGPAVYFEIHEHMPFLSHYSTTAPMENGEWIFPGSADYMVLWRNLADEEVEIQYTFSLLGAGAPPDYTFIIIALVAAGAVFAVLWFVWRGRGEPAKEE
ncbi:MAG: hypothetical protein ACE5JE_09665 [Thermoplasmata archaeon]